MSCNRDFPALEATLYYETSLPTSSQMKGCHELHKQLHLDVFPSSNEIGGDDYDFLRLKQPPIGLESRHTIRVVDLFAGCGGISLGIRQACQHLGLRFEVPLAVDFDSAAAECYRANFPTARVLTKDIGDLFRLPLDNPTTPEERHLASETGSVDLLVGGPPCQGHSDLNNSTRRNDPKNDLYLYMARAAEVLNPTHILIENVVGALHDKNQVVQRVISHLTSLGYKTDVGIVSLHKIGVPQSRRRLLVLASKTKSVSVKLLESKYATSERTVRWAIGDLVDTPSNTIFDTPAVSSRDTRQRIDYLFDNGLFDLPNEQRPPCHRDRKHTYNSVYGRLDWGATSQTITSGFYSMCMGRYVHPSQRRTLTAHEAARLQFFPDFFDFSTVSSRTILARIIGNAVPMKLAYAAGCELLSPEE